MAPQQACQERAAHQNSRTGKEDINQRGNNEITLKELQSSTAEIGVYVHRTTLSCTLHRVELYGRMARKKAIA